MHPAIHYEIAKAHIADLHQAAERDRTAKAARRVRSTPRHQPAHPALRLTAVLRRWVLTVLSVRNT